MLDLSKLLNVLKQNGRLSDGQDVPDEEQQTQQQRGTDVANSALSIIQPPQQAADATTGGQSVATGAQSIVRSPIQPDTPNTSPSIMRPPAQQMYDTALQKYNTIQNAPNPKVPKWANVLAIAGQTANDFFNNKSTPIESLGAIKKARNLAEAGGQLETAGKQYQTQTNIDNINTDNALNAKKAQQLADWHQQQADEKKQHDADTVATNKAKAESVARLRFVKNHGGFFDPSKASQADKNELATFGETPESIGKFDINKPDVRTVAGKSFQWNRGNGTWDEAGLPTDGSQQIVDITVTDPTTNIQHTYSTTSDHAASLQEGLVRTGMQIQASKARQKSQQDFQAGQSDLSRKDKLAQWVRSNDIKAPQFQSQLAAKVKARQMTQEQADQALADFNEVINQNAPKK